MNNNKQSLSIFLKGYENQRVKISTKSDLRYETDSLKVFEDCVKFFDKFGNEVMISISEISQITKLKGESLGTDTKSPKTSEV